MSTSLFEVKFAAVIKFKEKLKLNESE